jgi:hypothetical protein
MTLVGHAAVPLADHLEQVGSRWLPVVALERHVEQPLGPTLEPAGCDGP